MQLKLVFVLSSVVLVTGAALGDRPPASQQQREGFGAPAKARDRSSHDDDLSRPGVRGDDLSCHGLSGRAEWPARRGQDVAPTGAPRLYRVPNTLCGHSDREGF